MSRSASQGNSRGIAAPFITQVLEQARALGDYLIVGVHGDDVLKEAYGPNLPIMNLHERVLSVLACRYVDEVIIGAPYALTEEMIRDMHISCVVHGTTWEPEAAAAAAEVWRSFPPIMEVNMSTVRPLCGCETPRCVP